MIHNKNKKHFSSEPENRMREKFKESEQSRKTLVNSIAEKNRIIKSVGKSLDNMKLIAAGSILLSIAVIAYTLFK